jgi:Delta24-sterol reductase
VENGYLDAIMFTRNWGIVCVGCLTDVPADGVKIQRFSRPGDPWFYLHARKVFRGNRAAQPVKEAIPLTDYLFRYDRGAFWAGMYAFRYFATPFNRITRWALDKYMHTRVMYHALHRSGLANRYIVQDVSVPYSSAAEFLDYLEDTVGFYPIWLCPIRLRRESSFSLIANRDADDPEMLLNFGI